MHWEANEIFKILPFYNTFIDKPKVKNLNNAELLKDLPFYNKLNIVKNKAALVVMLKVIKLKLLTKEM